LLVACYKLSILLDNRAAVQRFMMIIR